MAATFAPLQTGPGFFVSFDLAKVLDFAPPEEDVDTIRQALEGVDSSVVYAMHLMPDAASFEIALPLEMIRAFAEIETEESLGEVAMEAEAE